MAKSLASTYTPGARRRSWLKIKSSNAVDLVVLAAEWGYGRRSGWLSNYHLGVLDEKTGGYSMVGKTFKGLRDDEFKLMTERLLSIRVGERGTTVYVDPQVVVEVTYNEIQTSPHYESGMALRFARITRIRPDKSATQIATLSDLRKEYRRQSARKGTLPRRVSQDD
jgi:DNA ligase-1